jgi:asparagine N-glycosylation enzyme membrane subunit Stt3
VNSIFRQGVSAATLFQLLADLSWLFVAGVLVIRFNEQFTIPIDHIAAPALVFAVVIVVLNLAFGMYQRAESSRRALTWYASFSFRRSACRSRM